MPNLFSYFKNAGAGSPGRKAKGTDPRTELRKNVKPKVLHFVSGAGGRQQFNIAPYNWNQINRAIATDTYVIQALLRYRELMWKEGYKLKSGDPNALVYIKQRMKVLGMAQGQSFEKLFQEIGENLVKYHNCFIYKMRDAEVGRVTGMNIKGLDGKDPIAGYFVIPTSTISVAEDVFGNVFAYRQEVSGGAGKPIDFKPEDIIHIRHMRMSGTQWGVPFLDAAIEDIRSFRIIEEDMLNIVHSEIYPLLHYMVNGMKPDWNVDNEDIDKAYNELLSMKDNGAIVTKGADKIDILGSGGVALDVQPYINHFKERAIIGLGLSPNQIGVSGGQNKSSSDSVTAATYDKIKTYQDVLEDCINNDIFFELLIEGGFDPLTAQRTGKVDPGVFFEFKEIDVDAQIKRENHDSVLWLQNMMTHGEMRERLGMVVDPIHDLEYHIDMVEVPLAEISKTVSPGGENPNSPAKGSAGSKNNPANQKGNRGGPKVKAWDVLLLTVEDFAVKGEWDNVYAAVNGFYLERGNGWERHSSDLHMLLGIAKRSKNEGVEIIPHIRGIFKTLAQSTMELEDRPVVHSVDADPGVVFSQNDRNIGDEIKEAVSDLRKDLVEEKSSNEIFEKMFTNADVRAENDRKALITVLSSIADREIPSSNVNVTIEEGAVQVIQPSSRTKRTSKFITDDSGRIIGKEEIEDSDDEELTQSERNPDKRNG